MPAGKFDKFGLFLWKGLGLVEPANIPIYMGIGIRNPSHAPPGSGIRLQLPFKLVNSPTQNQCTLLARYAYNPPFRGMRMVPRHTTDLWCENGCGGRRGVVVVLERYSEKIVSSSQFL